MKSGYGKASRSFLERAVLPNLGSDTKEVLVGPGYGLDNAVLGLGPGRVMIVTTDPVSMIPPLGVSLSAWLSVHLVASDFTTSGLRPMFATFSFNFPPEIDEDSRENYVAAVGSECKKLGVSIVSGNTGSYPGAGLSVIGAGTMFGFGPRSGYVDPSMAQEGDSILMTKHAAIEATSTLSLSFPKFIEERIGRRLAGKARRLIHQCSTVEAALSATKTGLGRDGITSMHDATEGGVLGGLSEMASASGKEFLVNADRIAVPEEVKAACAAFGIDPLTSLSEGTLLMTCNPHAAEAARRGFRRDGIRVEEIGSVERGSGLRVSKKGRYRTLAKAPADPYWRAYERAKELGYE